MRTKRLFITITVVIAIFAIGIGAFGIVEMSRAGESLLSYVLFPGALLAMAALVFGIGRFIYKDASRHGMDPWLWTTIAVYVPNLIGVILYFVARGRSDTAGHASIPCRNCGRLLTDDQLYCPRCGTERGRLCERCRNPLHPSWEYCPGCGAGPIKHGEEMKSKE
ncbi:zinc ribbon domain-containing protein [Paenibacillus thiaminolyticus]|uniref:zinc ribbon domain-containing protein n=1 Tax=Paenibacillus thiaminolyticus TaxID=49283 RepID=UPI0035A7298E